MKWTEKSRLGQEKARSSCLKDKFVDLEWFQAYPTDRFEELTNSPRRAPHLDKTSARSKGKWSWIKLKLYI